MLYRRYFVICSLLVVLSIVFLVATRTSASVKLSALDIALPTRRIETRSLRISAHFQWAQVDSNKTISSQMLPIAKPTKKRTGILAVDIIKNQTQVIAEEMGVYSFPDQQRPQLSDYIPARGGCPMSYLVLSTWESYSTMLGDILNTVPGNFHFHEPLARFGISQLNDTLAASALVELKNLMNCNYTGAEEYLKDAKSNWASVIKNKRLYAQCRYKRDFCFSPEFLKAFCKQFPIKSMSIVRLRLSAMAQWLLEKDSDIRIILFVRDPRAVMQARQNKKWCKTQPDCADTKNVCQFMTDDWLAYKTLSAIHPGRIKPIRFEDLVQDPFGVTRKLFEFLRAPFTEHTTEYLMLRTEEKISANGTIRQMRTPLPFLWRERIAIEKVEEVQRECVNATIGWGYRMLSNETLLDPAFIPLTDLPADDHVV